jgi:hypothetical protein
MPPPPPPARNVAVPSMEEDRPDTACTGVAGGCVGTDCACTTTTGRWCACQVVETLPPALPWPAVPAPPVAVPAVERDPPPEPPEPPAEPLALP